MKQTTTTVLTATLLALHLAGPARAAPYWVAWEGNDYPENEGWTRIVDGVGPAVRSIHDGIMTLDGLWDRHVDDYYRIERPLDPGPGEQFVMQWRLRVNEVIGSPLALYDTGVGLFSDEDWELFLVLGTNFVRSFHEDVVIPFEQSVFHTFEVRSADMQSYELRIDGSMVYAGSFWEPSFRQARLEWGDYARGSASLSDWDYFRFGVVPEPNTCLLLFALRIVSRTNLTRRIT